jgi:hypothetical protein
MPKYEEEIEVYCSEMTMLGGMEAMQTMQTGISDCYLWADSDLPG